jgi:K+-sensing histidine kinase KdpD
VFISAWLSGRLLGLLATAVSTLLVWWLFLPPASSFSTEPRHLFALLIFGATGALFAVFNDPLGPGAGGGRGPGMAGR